MIILVGGSSHCGKTLLAQKLMERLQMPYLSLDHLKMAFIRTKMTTLTVYDDRRMRDWLWPFVAEMIKTAIENNQNMIIEGCYIPQNWQTFFEPDYLTKIKCLYMVMSENYLRTHFDAIVSFANVIESRLDDKPDLERLIKCSNEFRNIAKQLNLPCIEIDKEFDIESIVDSVCRLIE